ncbi:Hypothetical predicted protein, partial [Olea europaea subsp. europaea]
MTHTPLPYAISAKSTTIGSPTYAYRFRPDGREREPSPLPKNQATTTLDNDGSHWGYYPGTMSINVETTDSNDGAAKGKLNLSMSIFVGRSRKKRKGKQDSGKGKKKKFEAREMTDESAESALSETNFNLVSMPGSGKGSDDNVMQQMEDDVVAWLEHCRIVERIERDYLSSNKGHR